MVALAVPSLAGATPTNKNTTGARRRAIRAASPVLVERCRRLDLAIQSLEEALEADASQAIIHYNLACYWSLAGNVKLAVAYLSQAFDLEPEYRELVLREPDFDPIRNHPHFQALTSVIV